MALHVVVDLAEGRRLLGAEYLRTAVGMCEHAYGRLGPLSAELIHAVAVAVRKTAPRVAAGPEAYAFDVVGRGLQAAGWLAGEHEAEARHFFPELARGGGVALTVDTVHAKMMALLGPPPAPQPIVPAILRDMLSLVLPEGYVPTLAVIESWTEAERQHAEGWAAKVHADAHSPGSPRRAGGARYVPEVIRPFVEQEAADRNARIEKATAQTEPPPDAQQAVT